MSTKRVKRTDIGTLRPVERRPDGTIRVDAYLTKCGVFQYLQPDGTVRKELRLPEDVSNPQSLRSFEGVPVTNDHPPGMIDAKNAKQYQVGAALNVPVMDDDHVRGRLSVTDADTIAAMESGKTQVSCGYTCDCVEEPGVHPLYGPYDAIQRNIIGNHVAIVDRARAGITASARMDGWMVVPPGTDNARVLTNTIAACNSHAMAAAPTARIEVVVKHDAMPGADVVVDPGDEANRNAKGLNDAPKTKKRQPGQMADRSGDTVHGSLPDGCDPDEYDENPEGDDKDDDDDDGDEDEEMDSMHFKDGDRPRDAYDESYGDDGELTQAARDKIKASNFAVPDQEKLPIHDKAHVRAAMARFGQTDFSDADEKHAAFNRIKAKAKQLGVSSEGFEKANANKLDRLDSHKKDTMNTEDIKALQEKADKRKEKLVKAKARIDQLEQELAAREASIQNLTKEIETAKTVRSDGDEIAAKVDAKIALLDRARTTGAKVDAKMSDRAIKVAVVKHVDGDDIPADKHDAYVDGVYEGALKRAGKDAAETARGAAALAATRQVVAAGTAHADAAQDTDEEAAKRRLRADSYTQWNRKETK